MRSEQQQLLFVQVEKKKSAETRLAAFATLPLVVQARATMFASAPELQRITDLDQPWQVPGSGPRLKAIRAAAERLHDRIASGPEVVALRTLPLSTVLYPTKYAFWGAALSPAPYVVMTHRCLLVQFLQRGELKTLLFNPTDVVAARETPFLKRLAKTTGEYLAYEVLTRRWDPLETQLALHGLLPTDIDYIAFDHFHTQDLRPQLGTTDGRLLPRFSRAKLLAPKNEWDSWQSLHPLQKAWFIADGRAGVHTQSVVLTDGDYELGDGVWLLRTPGHTVGNQTIFIKTSSGVWGCSENGTCVDAYSPLDSKISGLKVNARMNDTEVTLNANTAENAADQYASMMLERTLVHRVKHAPAFVQMFASSEVTPTVLSPGITPSIVFEHVTSGAVVRPQRDRAATL